MPKYECDETDWSSTSYVLVFIIYTNNPINPEAIEEIIKMCEPSLPAPLTEEEREYIRFTIHSLHQCAIHHITQIAQTSAHY